MISMKIAKYTLSGGLSKLEIQNIHKGALKILKELGIGISHHAILRLLSKHKGVAIEGTRVKYEPDLVEICLEQIIGNGGKNDSKGEIKKLEKLEVATGGITCRILDMNTGRIRKPLVSDLVEMTKLADSLNMKGAAPIIPHDIPSETQDLVIHKVCWENSRNIGGGRITSLATAEYVYEMAKVANKPFQLPLWVSSPLQLNTENLDVILHFLDRNVSVYPCTMPLMGLTAPIFIPAAFTQLVAELLGAAITLQLISKGGKVHLSTGDMCPFDMKYTNAVYGSPEHNLIGLMEMQISRYYGLPIATKIKGFKSMGKEPDAQAAAERAMGVLTGALLGANCFFAAGRICEDEVFSGEQLVIDKEIMNYVSRFIKGFEFKNDDLSFQIIKEVGIGGSYLAHATTMENYRQTFWIPELFEYSKLDQWKEKGGKSIRERAREIAKKKIKEHHFELDRHVQKELDEICKRARESLL